VLELLDRAFKESEQLITEELRRQRSSDAIEFAPVQKQIAAIDEEIGRLLHGLRGTLH
jgi:uncharacterized protein involved in exopolysaccharide biosynthesis